MPYLTRNDRQAILDRVHHHFITQGSPAGRRSGACCVYHGSDKHERPVACVIGIFDTEGRLDRQPLSNMGIEELIKRDPEALPDIFGLPDLDDLDVDFLTSIQGEHDVSARHAALSDEDFDVCFIEELAHRLDRFAHAQNLVSPCSPRELGSEFGVATG